MTDLSLSETILERSFNKPIEKKIEKKALLLLSKEESEVIKHFFGIGTDKKSNKEVSVALGYTNFSKAMVIKKRAINKLKTNASMIQKLIDGKNKKISRNTLVFNLPLSHRCIRAIAYCELSNPEGVYTLGQLLQKNEDFLTRRREGVGKKSIEELKYFLKTNNLKMGLSPEKTETKVNRLLSSLTKDLTDKENIIKGLIIDKEVLVEEIKKIEAYSGSAKSLLKEKQSRLDVERKAKAHFRYVEEKTNLDLIKNCLIMRKNILETGNPLMSSCVALGNGFIAYELEQEEEELCKRINRIIEQIDEKKKSKIGETSQEISPIKD